MNWLLISFLILSGTLVECSREKRQFNQNYQPGANFKNFNCGQNGCQQVGGSNNAGGVSTSSIPAAQAAPALNNNGQVVASQQNQGTFGNTANQQTTTPGSPCTCQLMGKAPRNGVFVYSNGNNICQCSNSGVQAQPPLGSSTGSSSQVTPNERYQSFGPGSMAVNIGKRSAEDYFGGSFSTNNGGRKKRSENMLLQKLIQVSPTYVTKRDAEAQFNQNYHPGSNSVNNQCLTPGSCGNGNSFSTFNQGYYGGSSSINNGGRRKRSENMLLQKLIQVSPAHITKRFAEAQFNQNYQRGSNSVNNQCLTPGSCGNGNSFSTFNQDYFGGSFSTNNGGRRKRSENMLLQKLIQVSPAHLTKRDAEAQFNQNYQPGSNSVNNQCLTPGSCGNGHSFSTFNQGYYGGSSSINNGRR